MLLVFAPIQPLKKRNKSLIKGAKRIGTGPLKQLSGNKKIEHLNDAMAYYIMYRYSLFFLPIGHTGQHFFVYCLKFQSNQF